MLVNIYLYIFRVAFFSLSVYFKRDIVETFQFVTFVIREGKRVADKYLEFFFKTNLSSTVPSPTFEKKLCEGFF